MPMSPYMRELRGKVGNMPVMVPAVTSLIFDDRDRVLLQRARDDGKWHTVGGMLDPGEEPAHAAVREAREETGLLVRPLRVVGVYARPAIVYANGDVSLVTGIAFACEIIGGELRISDDESLELHFFARDEIPSELPQVDQDAIAHALNGEPRAQFRN